jgi:hypothetical protein
MATAPNITVELSEEAVQKLVQIREASTSTAESALAAVYAAIEREAKGYDNAGVLSGLAELVTALKSRAMFDAGPVLTSVSGDASPMNPFPNRPVF